MKRPFASVVALMLAALLMLAACGSSPSSATSPFGGSAKAAACSGLTTISQTLTSLLSVNANTTVGDVKAVQAKVTNALNAIESRVPNASGQLVNQIRSANDQLTAKLQGYPDSTPIGRTSATIQDIRARAASAQAKTTLLATALRCSS
jgi:hypothetical protein